MDVEPDIDTVPRFYCAECRKRTLFKRDLDGYPICRECASDEEKSDE
jgi:hypothetical protein